MLHCCAKTREQVVEKDENTGASSRKILECNPDLDNTFGRRQDGFIGVSGEALLVVRQNPARE